MRMAIWISALLIGIVLAPVAAGATARGVVFDDRNGNGQRDAGEPGLADVGVSDGRQIVRTDADGRYRLEVDDDVILFVLKPSGWRTPIDERQLPRFYYIHRPAGSPALEYGGVEPTGPLPESIDFPLMRQDEPERFHAILFGDPQPRDQREIDYLAHDIVAELVGSDASFGVTLGDILYDDLSLFESMNRTIALIGIPWYNVVGNHDINFDAKDDVRSNATFERSYGPPYYSFDYGPVHFLVVDDVHWKGAVEGAERPGRNYTGGLGGDQLEFIRRDLERVPDDRLVVLFMHIPLTAEWVEPEREALFRLLEERRHCISIAAHFHYHEHLFLTEKDGWKGAKPHHHMINVTTSGSWWRGAPDEAGIPHATMRDGAPNGYTTITFEEDRYEIDFKAARRPATEQIQIAAPDWVWRRRAPRTEVLANVYNGSERSQVEMRVRGVGGWRPMEQVAHEDPHYVAKKLAEDRDTEAPWRPLPDPVGSPHLWRALLPELGPGHYLIEVRETDMWGRIHTANRALRVR